MLNRRTVIGLVLAIGFMGPHPVRAQIDQYNACWGQDEKQCTDRSVPDQTFFACETEVPTYSFVATMGLLQGVTQHEQGPRWVDPVA